MSGRSSAGPASNDASSGSLPELLLVGRNGADADTPSDVLALLGTVGARYTPVSLGSLRSVIVRMAAVLEKQGIQAGDTVCLIRLPRTSELLLAVAYASLTASGIRVLLPMYTEPPALGRWLAATETKVVAWGASEVHESDNEADRQRLEAIEAQLARLGVPALCLSRDIHLPQLLEDEAASPGPHPDDERVRRLLLAAGDPASECLLLTTAGTSRESRIVRYRQGAFLRSCASWQAAGLFAADRMGGRGLCLLFSHSMGVRAFWNAIWTRQPLCLIPPEWFLEHPERVRQLLLLMRPENVIGGPAVYRALLDLAGAFPDLREHVFGGLRCAISCGAPFDASIARELRAALDIELHDGFGTTETMMIFSTLAGPGRGEGTLGQPLPGVEVKTESLEEGGRVHRLLVHSPFGCAGYVPTAGEPETPWPYWYATGDLVQPGPPGLRYLGRENDGFVKDPFGVKLPRLVIDRRYEGLGAPIVHVEWRPLRDDPGLGALVYVECEHDGEAGRPITASALLDTVRALIEARHAALRLEMDDFELRHLSIARFACLPDPPPRTPKGTVTRAEIDRRESSLLEQLLGRDPAAPGIVTVERWT